MSDVISRHATINTVHRMREILDTDNIDDYVQLLVVALEELCPAQRTGRWIPCSERLPEVDEMVLATTVWDDVTIAWRIGVNKWFIHEGGSNATTEDLIAWMPLPVPYREGES